jgi:hypothetical protein
MRKINYYILCIILFSFTCCKRDNSVPQTFTEASYPLAVGDWWQYQITYCFGGYSTDTFMLSIVSMNTVGSYVQYNCNFVGSNTSISAGYFLQCDTSISFVNTSTYPDFSAFPNFYLRFPVSQLYEVKE